MAEPSLLATIALVKQWSCFFIAERYQCNGKCKQHLRAPKKGLWWWCLLLGMWNGWIQHQDIRPAKKNHRNKTGTQKLTQMLCIFHTLALAATTAEIISCSSWDSLIHHHIYSNGIMTPKGNMETAVEPYLGPASDWGPTQFWPAAICSLRSVPEQKKKWSSFSSGCNGPAYPTESQAWLLSHMKLSHRQEWASRSCRDKFIMQWWLLLHNQERKTHHGHLLHQAPGHACSCAMLPEHTLTNRAITR